MMSLAMHLHLLMPMLCRTTSKSSWMSCSQEGLLLCATPHTTNICSSHITDYAQIWICKQFVLMWGPMDAYTCTSVYDT